MPKYLPLPSGAYFEVPDGLNYKQAVALAQKEHPNEFLTPGEKEERQGFGAALSTGWKGAKSDTEEGLGALLNNQTLKDWAAQDRAEAEKNAYIPTTSEDVSAAMKQGLIPGAGAAFRKYVSEPIGGIAGRYGAPMLAGAVAAPAIAVAAPELALGAGATALIGGAATALADLPAEIGGNVQARKEQGLPENTAGAVGAGVLQAALTGFGIPGMGAVPKLARGILGKEATALGKQVVAGEITKEVAVGQLNGTLRNILQETASNAVTGTGMMVGTEALRRGQAGQSVLDSEAMKAYGESALGAAELAPLFGIGHGAFKRGAEKKTIGQAATAFETGEKKKAQALEDAKAAQEADAAQAAELAQRQQATMGQAENPAAGIQGRTGDLFGEPINPTDLKAAQVKKGRMDEGAVTPVDFGKETTTVREREAAQAAPATPQDLAQRQRVLTATHDELQDRVAKAAASGDLENITALSGQLKTVKAALDENTNAFKKAVPAEQMPEVQAAQLRGQLKNKTDALKKAGDLGDFEKIQKLAGEITAIKEKLDKLPQGPDLIEQAEINKKKDVEAEAAQREQEQQDLFAQVEKPNKGEVLNEEAIKRYQEGLQELEAAHAEGADERRIDTLLSKIREAYMESGMKSGEAAEQAAAKPDRIKRAIKEQEEAYAKATTDEEKAAALKAIGELQKRLAGSTTEGKKSPEQRQAEAQEGERLAHDNLADHVDSVMRGEEVSPNAAEMIKGSYAKNAVDEINASREKMDQQPLTTDEALKLTNEVRDNVEAIIRKNDLKAIDRFDSNEPTALERRIDHIKDRFRQGPERVLRKGELEGLKTEKDAVQSLEVALGRNEKEAVEKAQKEVDAALDGLVKAKNNTLEARKEAKAKGRKFEHSTEEAAAEERLAAAKKQLDEAKNNLKEFVPDAKRVAHLREEVKRYKETEAREAEEKRKAELKEPADYNEKQGELFTEKQLERKAVVRSTPEKFQDYLKSGAVAKIKNDLEKLAKAVAEAKERSELSKKTPRLGVDFLKSLYNQREFVKQVKDAEIVIKNLRGKAEGIWNAHNDSARELEVIKKQIDSIGKKIKFEETKPRAEGKTSEREKARAITSLKAKLYDLNEKRVVFEDRIKEIEAKADENKKTIDELYSRANEIRSADLKFEQAVLDSMERTLAKAKKGSPYAAKLEADMIKARAEVSKNEAAAREELEEQVKAKREAEQKRLEAQEAMHTIKREVVQTEYKTPNKEIPGFKEKQELLATMKEGTTEYRKLYHEIERMKQEHTPVTRKETKVKEKPETPEQRKERVVSEQKEAAQEMQSLKELAKEHQMDPKEAEKTVKELRELAEANDRYGKKSLAKAQRATANEIESKLKMRQSNIAAAKRLGDEPPGKARPPNIKVGAETETKAAQKAEEARTKANIKAARDLRSAVEKANAGNPDYYDGISGNSYRIDKSSSGKLDKAEGQKVADEINKKLPKDVKLTYVHDFSELPEQERKDLARDGIVEGSKEATAVKGFVNDKGEVFLVGGHHDSVADLQKTAVHELIGHVGVDRVLGEKGMKDLADRIYNAHGGIEELAKKLGVLDAVKGTMDDYALRIKKMTEEGASKEAIDKMMTVGETQVVRELIAHTAEARVNESFKQKAGRWLKELVGAVRNWLRENGFAEFAKATDNDIFYTLKQAQRRFDTDTLGAHRNVNGEISFSKKVKYNEDFDSKNPGLAKVAEAVIGREKSFTDRIKGAALGMSYMTRFLDRFAPHEYIAKNMRDAHEGYQMMYWNRMYDQKNNMIAEIATHGPTSIFHDKDNNEFTYKSQNKASLKDVVQAVGKAAPEIGNSTAALEQFGLYLAAERAQVVGKEKLNFSEDVTQEMLDKALKYGRRNEHFQEARKLYKEYNDGQIDFLIQSGRISKEEGQRWKDRGDYVAYYREKNGEIWDEEHNIRIGDVKNQKYLKELIGGDKSIVNFETGALQNTHMLTDMAMSNIATKNTAYTMSKLGMAEIHSGPGPASDKVVRFYENGVEKHAVIDTKGVPDRLSKQLEEMRKKGLANTESYKKLRGREIIASESASLFGDIPAELIVRGMEGVSMTLPSAISFMQGPANLLRKAVTRNPAYAMRVAFKDSIDSWIRTGADTRPVLDTLDSLKRIVKGGAPEVRKLQEQGIVGGHVFSGGIKDMTTIANQIATGQSGWEKLLAKADRMAIIADESARVSLYNGFMKKGMSPMEASLATLEAQNFTKHGYSPTIRAASMMIPFFNAQLQGVSALIRAGAGKSLFEDKLNVKDTIMKRGAMLAGMTMAYTALMQNNKAYKNATEDEKLGYWFVPVPGIDEPVKVPIPFEAGVIFKALPEGVFNLAATDAKSKDVLPAMAKQIISNIPGVSTGGLPQGIKPVFEAATNTDFYSWNPIESQKQLALKPGERSTATTTEFSKMLGRALGVSPIQIDHMIKGYTSGTGVALMSAFNPVFSDTTSVEGKGLLSSTSPIIGGFFQANDGSGLINKAFDGMTAIDQANQTYKKLQEEDPARAEKFYNRYMHDIDNSSAAGAFKKQFGALVKEANQIRLDKSYTSHEKRRLLDQNKQDQIALAKDFNDSRD